MKKGKIILLFVFILGIGSVGYGFYMYNKPSKTISEEAPEVVISAKDIISDFSNDAVSKNVEFLDKVVQVSGIITLVESNSLSKIAILENGVKCEFNDLDLNLEKGTEVTIKGLYTGYDDMFNELSLIKCSIIKQ